MKLPKNIRDNLRFLCIEIDSLLESLESCFLGDVAVQGRRILDRGGYAYNLKVRIHNASLTELSGLNTGDASIMSLRGAEFIATDLERIAELCRESVKQINYLEDIRQLHPEAYPPMLALIREGIAMIGGAARASDSRQALQIGQLEPQVDRAYHALYKRYITALNAKHKRTESLVTALFIAHNIEQMGDALRNMSETIISANIGQPVNFERYHALQESVEHLETAVLKGPLKVVPIAETRSGSAISGVHAGSGRDRETVAIFKEGQKSKLKEERQGVESWHEIYPGLAPRILSYKKRGQSAALLIEHLPGLTFEQILLNGNRRQLAACLERLNETLQSVWTETRNKKPVAAGFIAQTRKRLPEIYKIHPEFQQSASEICGLKKPSFADLLASADAYEKELKAPFSVYIHGDFNVDNIIYDPAEERINFIDLHRSRYMDYVQDVSVFMVSNYRLQILDHKVRQRIMAVAREFCESARRFAVQQGDDSFEIRLALGLARSFITSTRFTLDKSQARSMFQRSCYLIELVLNTPIKDVASFKVPIKEIFIA
ncbi:Uncharacterised protein [Zhongshania aliphaticivorans]|uniref:Aminoglycoside phosphotransferase domain-containing protein n=1 Tax=Zhongshania aliphaticivorans TaxID=1470434 RepID=A0A5S9N7G4_9GAMM|nr:PhoU domain-containing protein [Zhongshania aliphaticivorans]CAA0081189.1 Uncharacterised protein [Zhongshania aliphaticivorans]CAA0085064.1 Uncharacterised protein [Zhongshania aliphaticivorans]